MKLPRQPLCEALKKVSPALPSKSAVGGFLNIWFSESSVWATDGVIGIDVPLDTGFRGGVLGEPLIGVLNNITQDEVDLDTKGESVVIHAGKMKVQIPFVASQEFIWRFSEISSEEFVPVPEPLPGTLKRMLGGVYANSPFADRNGITLNISAGIANVYATDGLTISSCMFPVEDWPDGNYVFSVPFCKEFLRVYGDGGEMAIGPPSAAVIGKAEELLYGGLIAVPTPTPYDRYLAKFAPPEVLGRAVAIPEGLGVAVKRAVAVTGAKAVDLRFAGRNVTLRSMGARGQVEDTLEADESFAAMSGTVSVPSLLRMLSMCKTIAPGDECLVGVAEDGFAILLSVHQRKD